MTTDETLLELIKEVHTGMKQQNEINKLAHKRLSRIEKNLTQHFRNELVKLKEAK